MALTFMRLMQQMSCSLPPSTRLRASDKPLRRAAMRLTVRVALKTAVNVGRNKVDSMRSYLETLLGLLKYMSSPFQNILRICKYHLLYRVLYSFMTSAKN